MSEIPYIATHDQMARYGSRAFLSGVVGSLAWVPLTALAVANASDLYVTAGGIFVSLALIGASWLLHEQSMAARDEAAAAGVADYISTAIREPQP